jgi:methenyltetrahydromethanopterin cyclohydrolase
MALSMNKLAVRIAKEMIDREKELKVSVFKVGKASVIDAGVKALGGFEAGVLVSKICLGGLASVTATHFAVEDLYLPAVAVSTDYPAEACMASQLAGWRVQVGDFFANGSGPARALAKKPKKLFEKLGYSETSDEAVLVLETEKLPTEAVVESISKDTGVKPENLYLVLVSPASIAGSVQVSARIVETGLFKLDALGFDLKAVKYGFGVCPVAPLKGDALTMAGITNDMLLYGGTTYYLVDYPDDAKLKELVGKAPSSASKDYGKSFTELVKQFGWDFLYKVDPAIFAPAVITVNNIKTGALFKAGKVNYEVLKKAIGVA